MSTIFYAFKPRFEIAPSRLPAPVILDPVPDDTIGGRLEHLITLSTAYRIRDLHFPWREIPIAEALARPGFIKWIVWNPYGILSTYNGEPFIGYGAHGQQYAYNPKTFQVALGDVTWWSIGWNGDMTG